MDIAGLRIREDVGGSTPPYLRVINIQKSKQMEALKFRTLKADEIECRVGTVTEKGCSLLLYKNARVDMSLLDEVVGPYNWKREHELINGNLFCTVSVRDNVTGEWVSKQDVGVESNTEKEKGQASDAFKRACVNWGIGRELYTAPFIWVNLKSEEWRLGASGRKQPKVNFRVNAIEYDDSRHVTYVQIVDGAGAVRYTFGTSDALAKLRKEAIGKLKDVESRSEVEALFKHYPALKNDTEFITACSDRCKEIA